MNELHSFIHVRRDGKPLIRDLFEAWRAVTSYATGCSMWCNLAPGSSATNTHHIKPNLSKAPQMSPFLVSGVWVTRGHNNFGAQVTASCHVRFFRFRLSRGHDFKPDPLDDRNGGMLNHHAILLMSLLYSKIKSLISMEFPSKPLGSSRLTMIDHHLRKLQLPGASFCSLLLQLLNWSFQLIFTGRYHPHGLASQTWGGKPKSIGRHFVHGLRVHHVYLFLNGNAIQ